MKLVIEHLYKAYSSREIFKNLSLTFSRGINYLIAPNGTGKSTLLKLIAGIEQKDNGKISFNGRLQKFSNYGSP